MSFASLVPRYLAVCAALIGMASWTAGATIEMPFVVREWHHEDGLPSEVVLDLTQDREGYLWLATNAGVVRFDGQDFELRVPAERIAPAHSAPVAIFAEADGLWVVPRSAAPLRYRHGTLTPDPLPPAFADSTVTAALLASDGSHWLALRDKGVLRLHAGAMEVFDAASGITGKGATRFAIDGRGRVWMSNDRFLGRYEAKRIVPVDVGTGSSELRIASSRTGGPWVIANDRVLKLDADDRPQVVATVPRLLSAHYVSSATEDRSGALWIGTRSQGVHRITANRTEHVPTSHENINVVREDAEGNLWVGTHTSGLNAIGPKILRLYDKTAGAIENAAYSVTQDRHGTIWYANGDGGIVRVDDDRVTVAAHKIQWPQAGAVSVAAGPSDHILFAGAQGVSEFPLDLSASPQPAVPSLTDPVLRLFVDHSGDAWIAADPGRIGRRSADGRYTTYGEADGFAGGDVRCFAQDDSGALWVGTSRGRLFRREAERFIAVPFSTSRNVGAINAIVFGGEEGLWLATAQAGIVAVYHGETRVLDTTGGLPDNNITQIVGDDHGFLWCGAGNAVFRLSRSDLVRFAAGTSRTVDVLRLGRDEGLKYITCTGIYFPGAIKARDGRLWFATRQGLLAIDPAAPLLSSAPRRVAIEDVSVDGRSVPWMPQLTLDPRARKLQIRFSILSLSASRRIQAQYRLDGFDSDWLPAEGINTASYPRLPPGRYDFHLRAGPANEQTQASLSIIVPVPWWQNGWIVGIGVMAMLAVVILAVRSWSTRRLRRRLEELEHERAIDSERARIAQNIHDDVGASLTHISLLTQAAVRNNSPEKLQQIYETTREVTRSLDEIVWATNPQHDTLESFAEYLAQYAQRFLGVANIRCRLDMPEQLTATPLSSEFRHHLFLCCREALHNVVKHAHATEVVIRLTFVENRLTIAIADDGHGLDSSRPAGSRGAGNGLNNMHRRMTSLGGAMRIESLSGDRGTVVAFCVDLK